MSEVQDKIINYFRNRENPVILSVSSIENSTIFARRFPKGRVYSFGEPPDKNADYPYNIYLEHYSLGNFNRNDRVGLEQIKLDTWYKESGLDEIELCYIDSSINQWDFICGGLETLIKRVYLLYIKLVDDQKSKKFIEGELRKMGFFFTGVQYGDNYLFQSIN